MKVIDLLNRIANGEDVPKRIKHEGLIYNWDITGYLHYEDSHISEKAFLEGYRTDMCLNDEVEIIEEQQDIDIQEIEELPKILFLGTGKNDLTKVLNDIIDNQNQQLQAVKQLDKKIK